MAATEAGGPMGDLGGYSEHPSVDPGASEGVTQVAVNASTQGVQLVVVDGEAQVFSATRRFPLQDLLPV
jgi:hypothetical protein